MRLAISRRRAYTNISDAIREIWGTSWDSDLASLRVFMRTLRKKIEADPSHPKMIQTHMGVGYRMQRL